MKDLILAMALCIAMQGATAIKCHRCQHVSVSEYSAKVTEEEKKYMGESIKSDNDDTCKDNKPDTWKTDSCTGQCMKTQADATITFGKDKWVKVKSHIRECARDKSIQSEAKGKCSKDKKVLEHYAKEEMDDMDVTDTSGEICFCDGELCNGSSRQAVSVVAMAAAVMLFYVMV